MYHTTLVVITFNPGNSYLYIMINYLVASLFVLSLAITSGGILLASHLRSVYKSTFLYSLFSDFILFGDK